MPSKEHGARRVCDSSKYTVFTDVSKFSEWILQHINITKSRKELKPCQDGVVGKNAGWCNAANRHDHDDFLLPKTFDTIDRISLHDGKYLRIVNQDRSRRSTQIVDMVYDCTQRRIYWIWDEDSTIYSANVDGTDQKTFITKAALAPTQMGVDWISRRLYWFDERKQTIEVASLEDPNVRTVLFNFKSRSDDTTIRNIAVDPNQGKLYWIEGEQYSILNIPPFETTIEWSNLDGSERQVFDYKSVFARSMKFSQTTGELCISIIAEWTDRRPFAPKIVSNAINCIDSSSKRNRTIVSQIRHSDAFFAITDELVYWVENKGKATIESVNLNGVRQKSIDIQRPLVWADRLEAVTGYCPMFYSQCANNNGGCPENTICLLSPRDPSGKICKEITT
ncbi:hypothetical protein ZHAS_00006130 [Anopheles sinensis]|uniref:Uncharacterized protein n=1 Tax=Anopheles sinensis TaxID=74873 RepID=A0A084VL88_ANOSI|nr:hypothetical protein ZHAS_00006130 [Anopheles sinensis]